jgi:hypothetical protein
MTNRQVPREGESPLVSVVIPVHNREATVERAISSALAQTLDHIEIIVVDDASTDGTADVVDRMADPRIRRIRHESNLAASAARNTGVDAANGAYVAFLDSDDEWLPIHLERRIGALEASRADGVFGSFYVRRGDVLFPRICPPRPTHKSLLDYILSGQGDVRSSTLLFRRAAIRGLEWDPAVRKHQDWDLAARADDCLALVSDPTPTAILHAGAVARMTDELDHEETTSFLDRHGSRLRPATIARFHTLHAIRVLRHEGRSPTFHAALAAARLHRGAASAGIRLALRCLSVPGFARAFVMLNDVRIRAKVSAAVRSMSSLTPPGGS